MKLAYDPEVDVLSLVLSDAPIAERDQDKPASSSITTGMVTSSAWRSWTPPNAPQPLSVEYAIAPPPGISPTLQT